MKSDINESDMHVLIPSQTGTGCLSNLRQDNHISLLDGKLFYEQQS